MTGCKSSLCAAAVLVCASAAADPQVCYEVTRVDANPPEIFLMSGLDLNDRGVVVGVRHPFDERAFAWRDGVYTDLHARIDPSALRSFAVAINNRGDIIGTVWDAQAAPNAFLLRRSEVALIQPFGRPLSDAPQAINNRGQVAGVINRLGYIWDGGEITTLAPLDEANGRVFEVQGINDRGVVVGTSTSGSGLHAVIWERGRIVDLGLVPGFSVSRGTAVNNRGQVVGWLGGASNRAFMWEHGGMTLLPLLEGAAAALPADINNAGQVVGWTTFNTVPTATTVGTLWTESLVPVDLQTAVCADDPLRMVVTLRFPKAINSRGQIVVAEPLEAPAHVATYLLTPRPPD